MGTKSKLAVALAVTLGALAVPSEGSAAEAETCAQGYMLCLNETQNADGWLARTRAETSCLLAYGSCLKHQAFGL